MSSWSPIIANAGEANTSSVSEDATPKARCRANMRGFPVVEEELTSKSPLSDDAIEPVEGSLQPYG